MTVLYSAHPQGSVRAYGAVPSSGTAEVRRFMAASACACLHTSSHSAERLRAPDPCHRGCASQDVITSTAALVHVPYDVPVRDTITGRVIDRGCLPSSVRLTARALEPTSPRPHPGQTAQPVGRVPDRTAAHVRSGRSLAKDDQLLSPS
jgi:hypothetical protein